MKITTVCTEAEKIWEMLPVLSCDYSVKNEIKCKKSGKSFYSMTCDGYAEIPLLALVPVICILGTCVCLCGRCICRKKKK